MRRLEEVEGLRLFTEVKVGLKLYDEEFFFLLRYLCFMSGAKLASTMCGGKSS